MSVPGGYHKAIEAARAYEPDLSQMEDVLRLARHEASRPPRGAWWGLEPWSFAAGLALGIGILIVGWVVWPRTPTRAGPVHIALGPRAGALLTPNTDVSIVATSPERTVLRLRTGTLQLRMLKGAEPHRLEVQVDDTVATLLDGEFVVNAATKAPRVHVIAGQARIASPDAVTELSAGERWSSTDEPSERGRRPAPAAPARPAAPPRPLPDEPPVASAPRRDGRPTSPPPEASGPPNTGSVPLRDQRSDTRPTDSPAPTAPPASPRKAPVPNRVEAPPPRPTRSPRLAPPETSEQQPRSPVELWQQARLLRGQAKYAEAIDVLKTLAATEDPVWAPLARLEQMRLYESRVIRPERVIQVGKLFFERHPDHSLVPEAEALYCSAHTQLGRPKPGRCP